MQPDSNDRHGVMVEVALPRIGIASNRTKPCAYCAWFIGMAYQLRQQADNVGHIFIFAQAVDALQIGAEQRQPS